MSDDYYKWRVLRDTGELLCGVCLHRRYHVNHLPTPSNNLLADNLHWDGLKTREERQCDGCGRDGLPLSE